MEQSKNQRPTAFELLKSEYDSMSADYELLTHPYFSTGSFRFEVVDSMTDAGGFRRMALRCAKGQQIKLFAYGIGDTGESAGLHPSVPTTNAETNIMERYQTDNEDVAIEGLSMTVRGVRVTYDNMGAGVWPSDNTVHTAIMQGTVTIEDVSATMIPPEISSPMTLQDALLHCVRGKVSVVPLFDRKAQDYIARLDKFPEGGANSYLLANGEPSHHNFFRLHEGFVWRKSNAATDKLFQLALTMENDALFFCTQPNLWQPASPALAILGPLKYIDFELTMYLHGRAFYIPSKNI